MVKKILVLTLLFLFHIQLIGQDTSPLSLQIFPKNSFVKINDTVFHVVGKSDRITLALRPGIYPIEIWASSYELFKDTITIEQDKPKRYTKVLLKRSTTFEAYKAEKEIFKAKKVKKIAIATGLIVANIGGLFLSANGKGATKIKDRAESVRLNHPNLASEEDLRANRALYEKLQSDFKSKQKRILVKRAVGIPLFTLTSFLTGKYLKKLWSKNNEKPKLKKDENPFVLDNIEINTFNATCQLGVTFKF